jgi:hypothetical protein
MLKQMDFEAVISHLRSELDRVERAIVVFEALEKKVCRRKESKPKATRSRPINTTLTTSDRSPS